MNTRFIGILMSAVSCALAMSPAPRSPSAQEAQREHARGATESPAPPHEVQNSGVLADPGEVLARIGTFTLRTQDIAREQRRRSRDGLPELNASALFDALVRESLAACAANPMPHDQELDEVLAEALLRHEALTHMAGAVPDEARIQEYYREHLADFTRPARVRLSALPLPSERAARETRRDLSGGASFEELAAQSADPVTRRDQGDLGWVAVGTVGVAPALITAGLALASLGDIADDPVQLTVQSGAGRRRRRVTTWYLVGLSDREPARTLPLNEVRQRIAHRLTRERYLGLRREARERWRVELAPAVRDAIDERALLTLRVSGR